ncbi:MAG: LacI family DNA-binding transcriptional regulator [Chloroflexi bacterium]|nr:LacI family DNA-binding transcriptional regulator [Chloroflexota bacterium]
MATLQDIAAATGVAASTVSLIVNGRASAVRISVATRTRVLEAARQMGYTPDVAARRLRAGGQRQVVPVLAILTPVDARLALVARVVRGVRDSFARASATSSASSETAVSGVAHGVEPELLLETYVPGALGQHRSLMTNQRIHGAILVNLTPEDEAFLESTVPAVPIVLFQRSSDRHSYVNLDNEASGRLVAEHLLQQGHRRFGLLVPTVRSTAVAARRDGFLQSVLAAGIPATAVTTATGAFSEQGGADGLTEVLDLQRLEARDRPTAVFALSDTMAVGALYAARRAGVRVPDDLAVVGHDGLEVSSFLVPSLTTVDGYVEQMASRAATVLLDLVHRRVEPPVQVTFTPRLLVRDSSRPSTAG